MGLPPAQTRSSKLSSKTLNSCERVIRKSQQQQPLNKDSGLLPKALVLSIPSGEDCTEILISPKCNILFT
jgi:hypothetical protein